MSPRDPKARENAPVYADQDLYMMTDLEQVRVLADPLRMRILEGFHRERTTKQVAEAIGEKPTKLYHHVEALERVGLIRMTRTRQNRGTLEKYFLAVAKRFQTDPQLFANVSAESPETEALQALATTAFHNSAGELRQAIARGETDLETNGALCFAEIHASQDDVASIQKKIEALLADIVDIGAGDDEAQPEEQDCRYRLTLAFFPLAKQG